MGWLDVLAALVWTAFWVALAVFLLLEGGSLLEACLVLVVGAGGLARWLRRSHTLETLRDWRRR